MLIFKTLNTVTKEQLLKTINNICKSKSTANFYCIVPITKNSTPKYCVISKPHFELPKCSIITQAQSNIQQ